MVQDVIISSVLLLAEWSTVVAALGGSAIGATAAMVAGYFALRGTTLSVRSQEQEAWRSRRIEAVTDFQTKYMTAMERLATFEHKSGEARMNSLREANEASSAAVAAETLLALLFGPDSTPVMAAERMTTRFADAFEIISKLPHGDQEAVLRELSEKLDGFDDDQRAFMRAVYTAIRPTSAE